MKKIKNIHVNMIRKISETISNFEKSENYCNLKYNMHVAPSMKQWSSNNSNFYDVTKLD